MYISGTSPKCFSDTVMRFSNCARLETSVWIKIALEVPIFWIYASAAGVSLRSAMMILAPSLIAV